MKKLLLVLALMAPVMLFAQTPFDGTWITKLDTAQFPKKPDSYLLNKGMYECVSCVPKYTVKADGTDQKVTGHPYYDTVAVKVVDDHTVEITQKKEGKTMGMDTDTVSSDGNTLTSKFIDQSEDKPVTGEAMFTRVSKGPAGSHSVSGSWHIDKVNSISENGLTVTYQGTENGLKMSDPNGESYDAKFDGKDYPVQGDPGHTLVSLKRIGNDTIEETDKREGKVVGVAKMTVSSDGKWITVVFSDKQRGTTTTYKMEKQS
jgi:hypothetical protein